MGAVPAANSSRMRPRVLHSPPMFRPALAVYVLWHPHFKEGETLARELFTHLYGNLAEPESRGIGIPVFFRSQLLEGHTLPPAIDLQAAEMTVVLPLIDGKLAEDAGWVGYVEELRQKLPAGRLLPVHLSPLVARLPKELGRLHALRLMEEKDQAQWPARLVHDVDHELCRLLLNQPRGVGAPGDSGLSPAPVRLFVSHAKRDGAQLATQLKDYIEKRTRLETFFDAKDIAPGYPFNVEIFKSIERSALVVLQTDAYASREWCRREVIEAKRLGRPLLVVDALERGEERSFPYLGNVPTLRWNREKESEEQLCRRIVDAALREVLRCTYFVRHFRQFCEAYGSLPELTVQPRPPELLSAVEGAGRQSVIVYPDPPLGDEEVEILSQLNSKLRGLTPLALTRELVAEHFEGPLLDGWVLALSIGSPGEQELVRHGLASEHLEAAMVEVARYLLANGARLAYGGGLQEQGFTEKLAVLVRRHRLSGRGNFHRLENYLAWPRHLKANMEDEHRAVDHQIKVVPPPEDVAGAMPPAAAELSAEERYVQSRAMTAMRERMVAETDARVVLGGKLAGFSGRIPGVLEESLLTLRASKPLFVLGGFGGAAAAIARLLEGGQDEALGSQYQMKDAKLQELSKQYQARGRRALGAELDEAVELLRKTPTERLNNGLGPEDNQRLFRSNCLEEVISLVMKGLARLALGRRK